MPNLDTPPRQPALASISLLDLQTQSTGAKQQSTTCHPRDFNWITPGSWRRVTSCDQRRLGGKTQCQSSRTIRRRCWQSFLSSNLFPRHVAPLPSFCYCLTVLLQPLTAFRCKRQGCKKAVILAVPSKLHRLHNCSHQQQLLDLCPPSTKRFLQALKGISWHPLSSCLMQLNRRESYLREEQPLMTAEPRTILCSLPRVQTCCLRLGMPSLHLPSTLQGCVADRRIRLWSLQGTASSRATKACQQGACQQGARLAPKPGTP